MANTNRNWNTTFNCSATVSSNWKAAQEAFGDLGKLQDALEPYYRGHLGLPFALVPIPREDYEGQLERQNVTTAELNAWLAEYHLRFKRTTDAKPLIDSALIESSHLGIAHEAMGTYDILQADYENALKEFSAATTADRSLFLSFYYKGVLSSYWKHRPDIPESSDRDLRRAVELAPRYAPASLALARLLVRKGGNVTEAADFARRTGDAEPNRVRYRLALANLLLLAGEPTQAEADAQQALGSELSSAEEEDANTLVKLSRACKPGAPCVALGGRESVSGNEPSVRTSPPSTGQDAALPTIKVRGVVRSIACTPDGRVLTLSSQG